jgi:hypothetical protein
MRTLKLIAIGIILFASKYIHAQISVNLNIGTAPNWGPVGYAEAEYYYLPDVEAYYDVRATQFIYFFGRYGFVLDIYQINIETMIYTVDTSSTQRLSWF